MIIKNPKTLKGVKNNKIKAKLETLYECAVNTFDDFGLDVSDVLMHDEQIYIKVSAFNESCMFSDIELSRMSCSKVNINDEEQQYWPLSAVISINGPFTSTFQKKFLYFHKQEESENINDKAQHIIGKIVSVKVIQKTVGKIICEAIVDMTTMSGVIFQEFQSPADNYNEGKNILCLVRNVIQIGRKYTLLLDRITNDFIRAIFNHFFEAKKHQLDIKSIVRIPGLRTKIAIAAAAGNKDFDVSKIVGFGGLLLQPMIIELKEKVDLIQWFDEKDKMMISVFMPIKVHNVEFVTDKHIIAYVSPEDVVSSIGKDGLNIKMISILLEMKVTVKAMEKVEV